MNISQETVKTHTQKLIAKTGDQSLASAGPRLVREIVEHVSSTKRRGG
jgi:DNA-binding NarL/FixJ family response regulator